MRKRRRKAAGGGGQGSIVNHADNAPSAICPQLMALQRQRRFLIRTANRQTNAAGAYVRRLLGWSPDLPDAERAKIVKAAAKAVKACREWDMIEGEPPMERDDALMVRLTLDMAEPAQAHRHLIETRMEKLARQLPVYPWAKAVKGFGDLALAVVIGEAGDLSNYATKERLWKRLGLAVIDGIRQQKRSNVDEAAAHGYNPQRRAEIYSCVSESLTKWKAHNRYGAVYAARRLRTAETHPEWNKAHSHNDAMRVMTKKLLADLWREWRTAIVGMDTRSKVPSASTFYSEAYDTALVELTNGLRRRVEAAE